MRKRRTVSNKKTKSFKTHLNLLFKKGGVTLDDYTDSELNQLLRWVHRFIVRHPLLATELHGMINFYKTDTNIRLVFQHLIETIELNRVKFVQFMKSN
jgi:hypothetical protein